MEAFTTTKKLMNQQVVIKNLLVEDKPNYIFLDEI